MSGRLGAVEAKRRHEDVAMGLNGGRVCSTRQVSNDIVERDVVCQSKTCFEHMARRRTAPDILQLWCALKTHPRTTVLSILHGRRAGYPFGTPALEMGRLQMPSIQLESKKTFLIPRAVPSRLSAKWRFFPARVQVQEGASVDS